MNFQEILEFVGRRLAASFILRCTHPGKKQRAYSVATVFSGSAATQPR